MPFYNAPDGQYHFITSTAIVKLAPDISRYGELNIGTGLEAQKIFYKDGKRFEEFYQNEVILLSEDKIPRNLNLDSKFNYNYVGHLIPALAVKIGYHLSPTLGMMMTVGRLLTVFCYSLIMFFIIKFLKKGKLFFTTIALSPVILNSFASFTYDSFGFVAVAFILMLCINAIVSKKFILKEIIALLISLPIFIIGVKPNLYFILLLIPMTLIYCYKQEELESAVYQFERNQQVKKMDKSLLLIIFSILISGTITLVILTGNYGGIFAVFRRLFVTFTFRLYTTDSPADIINLLASPYPTINYTPTIIMIIWFLLVTYILFSEGFYHDSKWLSIGITAAFCLGVISTYVGFIGYGPPLEYGRQDSIQGVQGRYMTPLLLLFSPICANAKIHRLFNKMEKKTALWMIAVVVLISTFLLVTNTLYATANL
ncbi:MAG: DUF2142 domain-containing protein [Lactovum sp.]